MLKNKVMLPARKNRHFHGNNRIVSHLIRARLTLSQLSTLNSKLSDNLEFASQIPSCRASNRRKTRGFQACPVTRVARHSEGTGISVAPLRDTNHVLPAGGNEWEVRR